MKTTVLFSYLLNSLIAFAILGCSASDGELKLDDRLVVDPTVPPVPVVVVPSLNFTLPPNRLFPFTTGSAVEPILQGYSEIFNVNITDPEGGFVTINSCTFQPLELSPADANYVITPQTCANLPSTIMIGSGVEVDGTATYLATDGYNAQLSLTWKPTLSQRGTYRFSITATAGSTTSTTQFYVSVREDYFVPANPSVRNAKLMLDPYFSVRTPLQFPMSPRDPASAHNNLSAWPSLSSLFQVDLSTFATVAPWSGDGARGNPYALRFNGATDSLSTGVSANSETNVLINMWINPSAIAAPSKVILSNKDASNGFSLTQVTDGSGRLEIIGNSTAYDQLILASGPSLYSKLADAASATSVAESSGLNSCSGSPCTGTPAGGVAFARPGVVNDGAGQWAASFDGADDYIAGALNPNVFAGDFTIEGWFNRRTITQWAAIFSNSVGTNETPIMTFRDSTTQFGIMRVGALDDGVFVDLGANQLNKWIYATVRRQGSTLYVDAWKDGVRISNSGPLTWTLAASSGYYIGRHYANGGFVFDGLIDDVAVYNRFLPDAELMAHYSGQAGCRGLTALKNNDWYNVSVATTTSQVKIFVNGFEECAASLARNPQSSFAYKVADDYSMNQKWSGLLGDFKIYSNANGTENLTISQIRNDFEAMANRFRRVPQAKIVKNSLVLNLDPANSNGVSAFQNGCDARSLSWMDLSIKRQNGILAGFAPADCSGGPNDGWKGTSVPADPYRLNFDGVNDSVQGEIDGSQLTGDFTISAWFRRSAVTPWASIFSNSYNVSETPLMTFRNGTNDFGIMRVGVVDQGVYIDMGSDHLNKWIYAVIRKEGGSLKIDAWKAGTHISNSGALSWTMNTSNKFLIGQHYAGGLHYSGDIGPVMVHSRSLTDTEIAQNCLAHVSRFLGASCPAP